jgi:hypothetical protein
VQVHAIIEMLEYVLEANLAIWRSADIKNHHHGDMVKDVLLFLKQENIIGPAKLLHGHTLACCSWCRIR